jgi:hypothetical protein
MPSRINIPQRIVSHIGETIEVLRVIWVWHNRIRAQEPPQLGIIHPRAVIVDTQSRIALTGEQLISVDRPSRPARLAVGITALLTYSRGVYY